MKYHRTRGLILLEDPDKTVRAAAEEEFRRPGLTIDPPPFSFGGKDAEETG